MPLSWEIVLDVVSWVPTILHSHRESRIQTKLGFISPFETLLRYFAYHVARALRVVIIPKVDRNTETPPSILFSKLILIVEPCLKHKNTP